MLFTSCSSLPPGTRFAWTGWPLTARGGGWCDCNGNGIADECDIDDCPPNDSACADCNNNGLPDECDLNNGSEDQNSDGIPDECQDCNHNGLLDPEEPELQEDCNQNNIPDPCEVAVRGPIFLSGHDADAKNEPIAHCWDNPASQDCGHLYQAILTFALANSRLTNPNEPRLLVLGANTEGSDAREAVDWWNDPANGGPGAERTFVTDISDNSVIFTDHHVIYVPSQVPETDGGITPAQLSDLHDRRDEVAGFLNFEGGGVVALHEKPTAAYSWLPLGIEIEDNTHEDACPLPALDVVEGQEATCANLSEDVGPYHNVFTGPEAFSGLSAMIVSTDDPANEVLLLGETTFVSLNDCNANMKPDDCDITDGTSNDCQPNGIPDECDEDCDGSGMPDACEAGYCPKDLNGDGAVDAFDLAQLLGAWGNCDEPCAPGIPNCSCPADFTDDCAVNANDLAQLLGAWGNCS